MQTSEDCLFFFVLLSLCIVAKATKASIEEHTDKLKWETLSGVCHTLLFLIADQPKHFQHSFDKGWVVTMGFKFEMK